MKYGKGKSISIFILSVLLITFGCVIIALSSESKYNIVVEASELFDVVNCKRADVLIIDLRDEEDYVKGHIGISINLPYDDGGEKLLEYLENNKYENREIYLLCKSGFRSSLAFNLLIENGYKRVHYIRFGYEEFYSCFKEDYIPAVGECNCKD